jgi:ribose-phosphate pyrophosphokinase
MKIIACNSNLPLAKDISKYLKTPLTKASIRRFSDMEVFAEIHENIRGEDVFVIQSTSYPANDHVMELLVTIDALKRASAARITAVIPYFGYARQDRKTGPRTPISARLMANLIEAAGADRVLTMELHAGQIQGFFNIPVDNLICSPVLLPKLEALAKNKEVIITSPDVGGVVRARHFAKKVSSDLAIIDKRREKAGVSEVMNVIGDVKGKTCIMVDDMVDSGGTLCNAAVALMDNGAESVHAYACHGVLSGGAVSRISASPIQEMVITDTIAATEAVKLSDTVQQVSVAKFLGEAMARIHDSRSVSVLFD